MVDSYRDSEEMVKDIGSETSPVKVGFDYEGYRRDGHWFLRHQRVHMRDFDAPLAFEEITDDLQNKGWSTIAALPLSTHLQSRPPSIFDIDGNSYQD